MKILEGKREHVNEAKKEIGINETQINPDDLHTRHGGEL